MPDLLEGHSLLVRRIGAGRDAAGSPHHVPGWLRNAIYSPIAGVLLLAACGPASPGPGPMARDSAGIRITELGQPLAAGGAPWSVDAQPRLDIGVREGDPAYELDRVVAARRLSDGSVIVANAGANELRLFDARGRFLRPLGGAGEGPGEFRSLAWIQVVPGDTILATDPDLRRVSAFTPDGALQWTTNLVGTGYAWPGDSRWPDGTFLIVSETGDVWERMRAGVARPGQTDRNTAVIARYSTQGALLDTLGRFAGYEEAIQERDGRFSTTYPPWGRLVAHALAPDRVYVGTQEDGLIRSWRPDGTLAEIVRWPAGDLTITRADLDRFNEVQFELAPDDSATRNAIIARTASLPLPPSRAAYGRVMVDAAGLLWISEAHVPIAAPGHWTVLEPGVGVRGQVELPDRFDLYEIGMDWLLGRWTDMDGVQHVRVFGLRRQ